MEEPNHAKTIEKGGQVFGTWTKYLRALDSLSWIQDQLVPIPLQTLESHVTKAYIMKKLWKSDGNK